MQLILDLSLQWAIDVPWIEVAAELQLQIPSEIRQMQLNTATILAHDCVKKEFQTLHFFQVADEAANFLRLLQTMSSIDIRSELRAARTDAEKYLADHNIHELVKSLISGLLAERPENHQRYLLHYAAKIAHNQSQSNPVSDSMITDALSLLLALLW